MVVRLLGPVELEVGGRTVGVGGVRPRALLAVLAAADGAVVPVERVAGAVWSDRERPGTRGTLHVHVHAVRQSLGDASAALEHTPGGYRLTGADVDVRLVQDAISLARSADRAGDADGAAGAYRRALGHWRGEFCSDLPDHTAFGPARTLYEGMRLEALQARITADLRRGAREGMVDELGALVDRYPLRERLWGQLMVALYADGRPADALECYRRARSVLADEAGLDPGTALRELERAVLDRAGTTALLRLAAPGSVAAGTTAALTWVDPGGRVRVRPLGGQRLTLGRSPDADVPLHHDPAVSRTHAAVTPSGGRWVLADLGSRNGTFRNGVRVGPEGTPLAAGDLLRCGDSVVAVVDTRGGRGAAGDETVPPRDP